MDLVSSCKVKLTYFRIKELKDVLSQLGLPKQGKKQDLVDRILDTLSDDRGSGMWGKKNAVWKEEVAKLLDDTYRKMQISEASDLVSKGQSVPYSSNVKLEGEIEDSYQMDKIRCPCGSLSQTNSMIKCKDPRCHVWQHIDCVIIPDKPMEGVLPAPAEIFYCELCRLSRADPFWVTVADPLYPVKLTAANVPADGTNLVQSVEKTFQLTRADKDLLSKQEYDVQAWCMLLNDKVPFRMQWPQYADLQVNGIPVRVINRPGSQLLGANGRDDGPVITPCTRDGINRISLTGCDSRVFCLGVRIAKRRTIQQIFSLIPKESDGELFEDALARVRRCVGGGTATENADDSDSDLEIVADSIPVNLRCPMSGSRIKVAGRFKPCLHMGGFDLEVFVEMNQRSRKWQCPICLRNYSLENVIIDPYFNRITSKMQNYGEDVTEIEVKPDGSWRAKTDTDRREVGDLGLWHRPDCTLCVPMVGEANPKSEAFKHIKQEGASEGYTGLKLGIKKNQNGFWEVSKPEDVNALSSGYRFENFENHDQSAIPMGKSAKGSGKDDDDSTGTQDGGGNFDFSANSGIQLDSSSLNIDQTCVFTSHNSAPWGDAEVIVLSDSEEENDTNISSGTVYGNNEIDDGGVTFPVPPHGIPYSYAEDPGLGTGGSSCLDLFNANDHFGIPLWSLPPGSRAGPSFQLFGTDAGVSGSLADLQNGAINCPTSRNSYSLTAETAMASTALVPESSVDCPNVDIDDALVDIPFTFDGDDPSLQIFLPTRPSDALMQPNLRDPPNVSNSIRTEDWKSLRLGGDGTGGHGESVASENGLHSQLHLQNSKEGAMECSVDTASLLLDMNDNRSGKASRERSDSPFSFPRRRRSVRRRPYASISSYRFEDFGRWASPGYRG